MRNQTLLTFLLAMAFFLGYSQDEHTIAHSNYAPTKTFYLNPTNTLDNKVWLDVHVVGAGAFVQNNLLYFAKEDFGVIRSLRGGGTGEIQYNLDAARKSGFLDIDIQALTGSFQYKEHGFALGVRARAHGDFRRVTNEIGRLITEGPETILSLSEGVDASKMFMNQVAYGEVALSYSNMFHHFDKTSMAAGVTAKYLMGIAGAGIRVDDAIFNLSGPIQSYFISLGGSAAFAVPDGGIFSGRGFAVDLGFVYKRTLTNVSHYEPFFKSNSCRPYDYKYKLSAALLDLGFIGFNQGATRYDFSNSISAADLIDDEFQFNGFGSFADQFLNSLSETNSFTMYTPVALNFMADYNFENNFYASGQIMGGLFRQYSFGPKRPLIVAASGRYQRKWFEASASLSAYELSSLRLGLGLRLAFLTLGTDNLLSYFGVQDFYGSDLYFNIRFFFSKKPGCGKNRVGTRKSRKKRTKNNGNRNKTKCVKN